MTVISEDIPAAVAADIDGTFSPGKNAENAVKIFTSFLSQVTKDCVKSGAVMIGHVKSNVRSGNEIMSMSSTTDNGNVRTKTVFSKPVGIFGMTINVIVYGITEEEIAKILRKRISMIGDVLLTFSYTECKDPECDDPECSDKGHRIISLQ